MENNKYGKLLLSSVILDKNLSANVISNAKSSNKPRLILDYTGHISFTNKLVCYTNLFLQRVLQFSTLDLPNLIWKKQ